MWSEECKVQSVKCRVRVWGVKCKVWSVEWRV